MLTVSLHGIKIVALIGLYPEEKIDPNTFEVDVDMSLPAKDGEPWPFADYAIINEIVSRAFTQDVETLEALVQIIHSNVKEHFKEANNVKVCVRKLHPRLSNHTAYSQVCFEG